MTKKSWRDRVKPAPGARPQPEKEVKARCSIVERDGKQFGVVDLSFILEAGLPATAVEDVVEGLRGGPKTVIAEDPITNAPTLWLGPWDTINDAELTTRSVVQLICDTIGVRQGGGPRLSPSPRGGMTADWNTNIQTNPKQLGDPPEDLDQRVARGKEIAEGPDDALTLMIAAWQRLLKEDPEAHVLRLVTLARGVLAWLSKTSGYQTPLDKLEARARGLAQMIADKIPSSDEFVLLLTNQGEGGFYTHISSIGRDTTIELLTEYLEALRGDKLKRN